MKTISEYVGKYMVKWLTVATVVGVGGGFSAVALNKSIDLVSRISNNFHIGLTPLIGGVLVSMIYLWDRNASGFGTDHYMNEVNRHGGYLKVKTLFSKLAATAATLGFNGSGGVEGPMLVMGGSMADVVLKIPFIKNKFNKEDRRILTICGAAGAIGAIFRSPLGGGIFVVEILYRSSLHYGDLFPAMLSSTMGFVVYSMISKPTPLFLIPDYLPDVYNVPFLILAGILAGIASLVFMSVFSYSRQIFSRIPYSKIHPVLGGALTGLILLVLPNVGGKGNFVIQEMIDMDFPIMILLLLFIGKILATSFTVASGGSAGLVIPALFVGALAGNGISTLVANGNLGLSSSLVITGMAASLASIANVPVAAAIMLVEMVGLRLGVPATLGSIIGYAVGHSKVIYGINSPDQWQYEEMKVWRDLDAKDESH
ncbi:chloride channel protein [Alkalibacter saccharofermentans]|uniref:Chloride channel protein, CIC family n=1 Tax=Alkalibacter saccharofermentans DSM 14828 TaxID=1120975 RepID=A0A1M4ZTQ7_9FIRM|nr:chloride channel protein [Alkalibacter saccharofermentans]SHF21217.1 chloride channel protein, CIC family [Alkalibacter saccharofermentans DSM 14828]